MFIFFINIYSDICHKHHDYNLLNYDGKEVRLCNKITWMQCFVLLDQLSDISVEINKCLFFSLLQENIVFRTISVNFYRLMFY